MSPYTDWSLALNQLGTVVGGEADIHQSIQIILGTPKGSDPHNPEFGSDLWKYLDMPADVATPHIIREASASIQRWETRVKLAGISIQSTQVGSRALRVKWTAQSSSDETSVSL